MTDRGITMTAESVRAILDGRKRQTRRVLKPQPPPGFALVGIYAPQLTAVFEDRHRIALEDFTIPLRFINGDVLWVREAWRTNIERDGQRPAALAKYAPIWFEATGDRRGGALVLWGRQRPSIHMPRWASRISLRVTDVRVQRVQEISTDDARSEGIPEYAAEARQLGLPCEDEGHFWDNRNTVENFARIWDSINAKRGFGWDTNPWVAAISFERIDHA